LEAWSFDRLAASAGYATGILSAPELGGFAMFGIQPGDIVTTSYGTGPYKVISVHYVEQAPWYDPLGTHTYSLTLTLPHDHKQRYWINGIREIDGKFIARGRDEIYVQPCQSPRQLRLF
jgi:hypothetical protein